MQIKSRLDLVVFRYAAEHMTRISRIIKQPYGNALLVGALCMSADRDLHPNSMSPLCFEFHFAPRQLQLSHVSLCISADRDLHLAASGHLDVQRGQHILLAAPLAERFIS